MKKLSTIQEKTIAKYNNLNLQYFFKKHVIIEGKSFFKHNIELNNNSTKNSEFKILDFIREYNLKIKLYELKQTYDSHDIIMKYTFESSTNQIPLPTSSPILTILEL